MEKKIIHYYHDTFFPNIYGNIVARKEMTKALSKNKNITTVHFYYYGKLFTKLKIFQEKNIIEHRMNTIARPDLNENKSKIILLYTLGISQTITCLQTFLKILTKKYSKNEIIYTRGVYTPYIISLVKKFKRLPTTINESHNFTFSNESNISQKIKEHLHKVIFENFDHLITISNYTKNNWIKEGISEDKIHVLPSGFNEIQESKDKVELDQSKKIIMYSGHLFRHRGVEDLLYSAQNNSNLNFIFVGGFNKDIQYYKEYIKKMKYKSENITFLGHKKPSQINSYLKLADILVAPYSKKCPTVDHMSPLKLVEYMGSKKPIIVSDLPRIKDLVSEKEAVFFEADNWEDLSNKIKKVSTNLKKYEQMSKNAYLASKKYTWSNRVKEILRIVKNKEYDKIRH